MSDAPSTPAGLPEPSVDVHAPAGALFNPKQIALATLVATPLAGALLAAANTRAVGSGKALRVVVVATGAAATALIFGIDVWGAGPFTLLALPVSAGAAFVASAIAFARWSDEAPRCSHVSVLAVVIACWAALGVVGGAVVGAAQLRTPRADEALSDNVEHSPHERVSFSDGARRADADEIARALVNAGAFTGAGTLRVDVDRARDPNELRVSMRVPDDASPADLEAARALLKSVARHLAPPRCVNGRVVNVNGLERASGRLCP